MVNLGELRIASLVQSPIAVYQRGADGAEIFEGYPGKTIQELARDAAFLLDSRVLGRK